MLFRSNFAVANDQYINRVSEVDNAVNGTGSYPADKTVLMYVDYKTAASANMRYENGTLWTNYTTKEGFWVSPNVKVVLCLSKGWDTGEFDKIYDTETYSGREGLVDALAALNSDKSAFHGYLSAIIEGKNGATTIILDDRSGVNLGNLEPVKPMTVTINRMGSDGKDLGAVTVLWNGGAAITDATTTTAGTAVNNGLDTLGYEDPTPGNTVASTAFVEDGKMTVTFTYTKGASVENKTDYIRVTFQTGDVSGTTGPVETKTVPVTVDALGFGTLTAEAVEKYVPAGYKLVEPFAANPTAIAKPASGFQTIKVQVEEKTIKSVALDKVPTGDFWVLYGADATTTKAAAVAAGIEIKITYADDTTRNIAAGAAGVTWTGDANADGTAKATYATKDTGNLAYKVYANVASDVTEGTNVNGTWTVTAEGSQTTKTGKVTLTFTQVTGGAFDETAMATLVGKLKDNSTTDLTLGAFDATSARLVTEGKDADPSGDPAAVQAVFTVDVAVSSPAAASATIKIQADT